MANAIITFKIMAESPDSDFNSIAEKASVIAKENGAKGELRTEINPLAFGLKEINILGMYEVSDDADFDAIANKMAEIEQVQSAEVASMDLAMG